MNKELKKIIYFDENSATDLVYVKFDGKVLETHTNKKDSQHKVGVEIKPELPEIFKLIGNISKWKLPLKVGKFGYEYNRESEKIINKVVSNTVLTDYLKISKNDNDIKKFENIKLSIYPNSLAFFKLITPYMAMTDGEFGDENLKINVADMDLVLEKAKGYYELILEGNKIKKVLRFNLSSFKNSYSLADLLKMNLTYHAIKVGKINLDLLDIQNEFLPQNNEISIDNFIEQKQENIEFIAEVYDVILAGVFL